MRQALSLATGIIMILGTVVALLAWRFETKDNATSCRSKLKEKITENKTTNSIIVTKLEYIARDVKEIKEAVK